MLTPAVTDAFVVSSANEKCVRVYGIVSAIFIYRSGVYRNKTSEGLNIRPSDTVDLLTFHLEFSDHLFLVFELSSHLLVETGYSLAESFLKQLLRFCKRLDFPVPTLD